LGSSVRATKLRVALHQLELRLVSLVVRRNVVLRPLDLQAADRRGRPGDGSEEPDRPRLPTREERPAGRLRRLGARTARARCRKRNRGDEQSEKRLLHAIPPSWLRPIRTRLGRIGLSPSLLLGRVTKANLAPSQRTHNAV